MHFMTKNWVDTHIEQVGMRFSWVIVFFSFFRCWWAISTDKICGYPPPWVLFLWKSGKTTVNRCNRTGKHRLFAKPPHFRGRILLRTGPTLKKGTIDLRKCPFSDFSSLFFQRPGGVIVWWPFFLLNGSSGFSLSWRRKVDPGHCSAHQPEYFSP